MSAWVSTQCILLLFIIIITDIIVVTNEHPPGMLVLSRAAVFCDQLKNFMAQKFLFD